MALLIFIIRSHCVARLWHRLWHAIRAHKRKKKKTTEEAEHKRIMSKQIDTIRINGRGRGGTHRGNAQSIIDGAPSRTHLFLWFWWERVCVGWVICLVVWFTLCFTILFTPAPTNLKPPQGCTMLFIWVVLPLLNENCTATIYSRHQRKWRKCTTCWFEPPTRWHNQCSVTMAK